MAEGQEITDKLVALPDYRQKGSVRISTSQGPPELGIILSKSRKRAKDFDGDIVIENIDSILSALPNILKDRSCESLSSVNLGRKSRPNQQS